MKNDAVYKKSFNAMLDHLAGLGARSAVEPETGLAARLSVSRTTVRKALAELERRGILVRDGSRLRLARKPAKQDQFPIEDTVATSDRVEQKFLEWILRGDRKPDQQINGMELAREFNVSTIAIRDYLNRFTRFGLVEKRENSGWTIRGFNKDFALELFKLCERMRPNTAATVYEMARTYAARGDRQKALAELQRAKTLGFAEPARLAVDPEWAGLRAEPKFCEIVEALRAP